MKILEQLFYFSKVLLLLLFVSLLLRSINKALIRFYDVKRLIKQKKSVLTITPPSNSDWKPNSLEGLYTLMHSYISSKTLKEKLLNLKICYSLEIHSTKEKGTIYKLIVPSRLSKSVKNNIQSHIPEAKITESDFIENKLIGKVVSIKQTGHYAYPLNLNFDPTASDIISYVTGMMSKLKDNEKVVYQLVITPTIIKQARSLAYKLKRHDKLPNKQIPLIRKLSMFTSFLEVIFSFVDIVINDLTGVSNKPKSTIDTYDKPITRLTNFEIKQSEAVLNKLNSPLFYTTVKLMVVSDENNHVSSVVDNYKSQVTSLCVDGYQRLKAKINFPKISNKLWSYEFNNRLPDITSSSTMVLSAHELAFLYHLPYQSSQRIENVVRSLSKTLPAPISLKGANKLDIVIGQNIYHEQITPIGLTEEERARHCYVIGGTGSGKSTLLLYSILQDINNGKGVAVIDPHGDLSEDILRLIPKDRIKDVIYFNPADLEHPIGLNLLEISPNLSPLEYLKEKELVTETTVSIFKKMFSKSGDSGHRIEYLIRNTVHTALTTDNPTLFTIYKLLNNPKYCDEVVAKLKDQNLKDFWINEMGKAGDFARVKIAAGVTTKVGRFLQSVAAKPILEQTKSSFNFEDVINEGKIMICNISKGLIGEDTSELFGITLLSKFQLAALKRANMSKNKRKPFYIYVDEFQNFTTTSFIEMLAEARKYKLFLTMAQQTTSQQEKQIVNTIFANVGTVICFRTSNPQDMEYMYPIFNPYLEKTEISYLPAYNFYMRISAINPLEPFSGQTIVIEDTGSDERLNECVEFSKSKYTTKLTQNQHDDFPTQNIPSEPHTTAVMPLKDTSEVNKRGF